MTVSDIAIQQAVRRLRAIAAMTPGYAPALLNLAGEVEAAGDGEEHVYVPEAVAAGRDPRDWALAVAGAVIFGEMRRA